MPLLLVAVMCQVAHGTAVLPPSLSHRAPAQGGFPVLASLNLLLDSLLKVQIIMTSYRNVTSSLLSFLFAMMYYNEHSEANQ